MIDDVERKQDEIRGVMGALKRYTPRDNKYVEAKNKLLNNVENFYKGRGKIIEGKNEVFPFYYDQRHEYQMKAEREIEEEIKEEKRRRQREKKEEQKKQDRTPFDLDEVIEWMIDKEEARINIELLEKHFTVQTPSVMHKVLHKTNDKRNSDLVDLLNSGLKDLKEKIKIMSKEEREIENPELIVKIVEMILRFNKQDQQGKGLNILTPNQMLSRLPITLALLKAGNNSEKLKNEIRQLLYSLYRSKNMTKQVYNNLIKYI